MKLHMIAMLIMATLLVLPLVAMMARAWSVKHKGIAANASTVKTHESGMLNRVAEAAFGTRHLLAAKGTAANSIILCTAALKPIGPCVDEPGIGDYGAVAAIGAVPGTIKMVASKAIAEDALVYATAGGKVADAVVSNAYKVGKAASVAAADGDEIEVIPCFPVINP